MSEVFSSTMISVTWKEIAPIDKNGIITTYEILYEDNMTSERINTTNLSLIIVELKKFTHYDISVRAYTAVGPGPYSVPITNRTEEDGKFTLAWLYN